jgi:triacylglycerol esterase/lipase EstA (alpha/beta hydrolase family)
MTLVRSSGRSAPLRRLAGLLLAAIGVMTAAAAPSDAATARYPVTGNILLGAVQAMPDPSASPPGVNVTDCALSAAHPRPVILIDGTFTNMIEDWSGLGPRLANAGFCVFSTPLGGDPHNFYQTIGPVPASVQQLADFVQAVKARTGAAQVDLVGHSQGGMLAEYYVKLLHGAPNVHTVVGLSPTTHGSTLMGMANFAAAIPGATSVMFGGCPACYDQLPNSAVIRALTAGPIAQPGVSYTIIETHNEFVVTPAGSAFIREPGVHNIWLQSACPGDLTEHANLPYDRGVFGLVRNALDPAHARAVVCY